MQSNRLAVSWALDDRSDSCYLIATLFLNDSPFYPEHYTDFMELANSCREPGEYEILTCSCVCMPCAGIWEGILVSFEEDEIVWRIRQPLVVKYDDDRESDELSYDEYRFSRSEYIVTILAAVSSARKIIQESPVKLRLISWKIDDLVNFSI